VFILFRKIQLDSLFLESSSAREVCAKCSSPTIKYNKTENITPAASSNSKMRVLSTKSKSKSQS
jgi:hypothetical protein